MKFSMTLKTQPHNIILMFCRVSLVMMCFNLFRAIMTARTNLWLDNYISVYFILQSFSCEDFYGVAFSLKRSILSVFGFSFFGLIIFLFNLLAPFPAVRRRFIKAIPFTDFIFMGQFPFSIRDKLTRLTTRRKTIFCSFVSIKLRRRFYTITGRTNFSHAII